MNIRPFGPRAATGGLRNDHCSCAGRQGRARLFSHPGGDGDFVSADTHDWAGLRPRLADRVRLDWTSLNGGEPAEFTGEEVTEAWRTLLSAFDATHHQLGNFLVDEIDAEQARLRLLQNRHSRAGRSRAGGPVGARARYNAALRHVEDGWRAADLTLTAVWREGNHDLLAVAAARAAVAR